MGQSEMNYPMKYLVISDLHGSKSSAAAVRDLLVLHACSKILCLGDVLYHGPRNDLPSDYAPKEVIALLNPLAEKIIADFTRSITHASVNEKDGKISVEVL